MQYHIQGIEGILFLSLFFGWQYCFFFFVCVKQWVWEGGGCKVEKNAFYGSSAKPCEAVAESQCQTTVPADLMALKDDKA